MNVSTFMALIWVLFGSNCDYYKNLWQIYKTLKIKEVYALKASFTAKNCRRITWAILDDGRAFFDDVRTTNKSNQGTDMVFPQSYLIYILNNIRYAVLVERASFPDKWRRRDCTRNNRGLAKGGGVQWKGEQNEVTQGGNSTGTNRQTSLEQKGGAQRDWKARWIDTCNSKIKALMDPYLERFNGRIQLNEVLDAAGKRQTDLPMLPRFCYDNRRPFMCWNSNLGRCMYQEYWYWRKGGHPGHKNIPDDFAEKVCAVIGPGIQVRMNPTGGDGSPGKKIKVDPTAQA
jgi:hypothetical protein